MKATLLVVAFACSPSGCASLYTQTHDAYVDAGAGCSDTRTIPNVFSGFMFDLFCLPAENAGFFCLVDLPLSLVVDTIMLPYTAYRQVEYGSWYDQKVCKDEEKRAEHDESFAPKPRLDLGVGMQEGPSRRAAERDPSSCDRSGGLLSTKSGRLVTVAEVANPWSFRSVP